MTVRAVRAEDVPALTRLCGELGYASEPKQVERRLARVTADHGNQIFVAEDATGEVIGWVQVYLTRWLATDPRCEIAGLVVSETCRGRGVGQQLLQAAEAWTKEQGGIVVSLRSNVVRKDAHRFYERQGYAVTKTSLNFRKML